MQDLAYNKPHAVLASRVNNGISVTLLWELGTKTTAVVVRDDSTHERFELLVEPGSSPMDVYEHPYAYAAWRGFDLRPTGLQKAA